MKCSIIIAFFSLITLTNCSVGDNNDNPNQIIKTYWHLVNVSGGIAGVDTDFALNKIIWTFNEENKVITVNNTHTDTAVEDGLDTGSYTYSVEVVGANSFLKIGTNEIGHLTISQTQLIINQNLTTSGTGADGFIYTFKRVTIVENAN